MASDYTVIEAVRHHFGDDPSGGIGPGQDPNEQELAGWEAGEPFVGVSHDFQFNCPFVDTSQMAVLQFNAYGVSYRTNIIRVNDVDVPGGIYFSPTFPDPSGEDLGEIPLWHIQSLLVPSNVLQDQGNILHIESTKGLFTENFDDFIVDNIVIWFKLRERRRPVIAEEA
jgi:hypothetical protein